MTTSNNNFDPIRYMSWLILFILLFLSARQCYGQADTVICKQECIEKIVEIKTDKGKIKHYAVYNDYKNDVSELIPVSQSVMDYIKLCKTNGIKPSLGIKLKNNQIVSIIKYRRKYGTK